MAFGQVSVVEGGANQLRVGADQEAGGEGSGAASGLLAVGELADDLVRQISAFEQAEQVALLKMGIARQGEQNFLRGLFEEALNLGALLETLARGEVRYFGAILEGSGARAQGRVRVGPPAAPVARALICRRGSGQGRDGGRPHRRLGHAIKA